ncbi:DUF6492 family protein [Microbacterium luticocti]|uniref:DUF6492 family protein n=1 Tax=Microbacterium luticocti TaxID=451764 RepID=UPI00041AE61A|nr:DUF6492 family protein [Microbacterium luticocti]
MVDLGTPQASMVTISYRGDLALATALCRSADRYLDDRIEHVLVLPRVDVPRFTPLVTDRRRIVALEDVLPPGYRRMPLPQRIHVGPWQRRIREMWWTPAGPARGWIVQQIAKLAVPGYVRAETIVFADSDIELVAPLTLERLAPGGRTRLYRVPGATADSAMHLRWHRAAAALLGLGPTASPTDGGYLGAEPTGGGYLGADYIGNLITWRRSAVIGLHGRICLHARARWDLAVARCPALSEYILYGAYVDHVVGPEASGHTATDDDLAHAGWFYDLSTAAGVAAFADGFRPGQVAVAIQSTESFTLAERAALIDRISAHVAG